MFCNAAKTRGVYMSSICLLAMLNVLALLSGGCATMQPEAEEPALVQAEPEVSPEQRRRIGRAERPLNSDDPQKCRQAGIELLAMDLDSARRIVLRHLGAGHATEVRVSMIEAVAFVEDHESFPRILALIDDSERDVREAAADALGRFNRPEELEQMLRKLDDPATTVDGQVLLTRSLGLARSRDAVPILIGNLAHSDPDLRQASHRALTKITGRDFPLVHQQWRQWWENNRWKTREELLEDRLQDTEQIIARQKRQIEELSRQLEELIRLGRAPAEQRLAVLLKGLRSPHAPTRVFAAHALANMDEQRLQAVSLDNEETVELLTQVLRDEDPKVRLDVTMLIAKLKGKHRDRLISEALRDTDPEVLRKALSLVRKDANGTIVARVRRLLTHEDEAVREQAIQLLADQPPREAVSDLVGVLDDPSDTVRWFAVESLRKLEAKSAVQKLYPLLSDTSDRVREVTALTLGELGDAGAVDVLVKALDDKNERVRQQAAKALQLIGVREPDAARRIADELVKRKLYGPALQILASLEESLARDQKNGEAVRKLKLERVRLLVLNKERAGAVRLLLMLEKETQGDADVRKQLLESWIELDDLPALIAALEGWLQDKEAEKKKKVMELAFGAARGLAAKNKTKEALHLLNVIKKTAVELKAEETLKDITTLEKSLENQSG